VGLFYGKSYSTKNYNDPEQTRAGYNKYTAANKSIDEKQNQPATAAS